MQTFHLTDISGLNISFSSKEYEITREWFVTSLRRSHPCHIGCRPTDSHQGNVFWSVWEKFYAEKDYIIGGVLCSASFYANWNVVVYLQRIFNNFK